MNEELFYPVEYGNYRIEIFDKNNQFQFIIYERETEGYANYVPLFESKFKYENKNAAIIDAKKLIDEGKFWV